MIIKSQIKKNLQYLDKLFRDPANSNYAQFHSKLAILELSGWIEESMDLIISECASRYISDPANHHYVDTVIIEKTWGFEYSSYFRQMLMKTIGIIGVERLERVVEPAKFAPMQANCRLLHSARNPLAHTHLNLGGTTPTLDAPSVTLRRLDEVYVGLREIEHCLKTMNI